MEMLMEAARKTGQRIVVAAGWAGLERRRPPEQALFIDSVPHD